jgi:asparagine synthase (glutamine-hydrolysing)
MAGRATDCSAISAAARVSETGDGLSSSGGFFLVCRKPGGDRTREVHRLQEAFTELGFAPPVMITTETCIIGAYPSFQSRSVVVKRHPNGDFIFVCGTCLTEQGVGVAATACLSEALEAASPQEVELMGHYAVVFQKNGATGIKLDRFGGYHVFYNLDAGIVSSSFYVICSVLDKLTLSRQSACEYVFNGVVSGDETLFSEVALAPIQATIVVGSGGLDVLRPKLPVTRTYNSEERNASLDKSIALLDRYFAAAARSFGDRVNCALSGGYDSRLILAFLRRHGTKPRVYVYGSGPEKDVRFALEIARREGFSLDVIDKSERPIIPPAAFADTARRNFLAIDGYGYDGIFHNGAEIGESARRVHGNAIAFNGGGGEIFRNFFYLLDRTYTIREILWSFYSRFDPAACTAGFDSNSYYDGLERKMMKLLGSDERLLPRPTVEWLYHSFRCRAWDGKVDSIASRYGYTAMPYLERAITEHASGLCLAWKNHGAYEAELIRRTDRRLAGYPSIYGHDFSGPPPPSRRLADYATYLRPPWLRRFTYRVKYVRRPPADRPGYLACPYRQAVLPGGVVILRRLFELNRVRDDEQFARVLSLEYALRWFGSRVKADF